MKPKLSTRARNLSQRRRERAEGVDLSGQDSSLNRDSWVPAGQHREYVDDGEEEEEEEEEAVASTTTPSTAAAEARGREERAQEA